MAGLPLGDLDVPPSLGLIELAAVSRGPALTSRRLEGCRQRRLSGR
jgi:hypothetical protein